MPTPDQYGAPPSNEQVETAVKSYFEHVLFDPFSAHYEFGGRYRAYRIAPLIAGGGVEWKGWAVDVRVNAKNRMGGYTGWQGYHVQFTGDSVANYYPIDGYDTLWRKL